MGSLESLRSEYPGDAAWAIFVEAMRPAFDASNAVLLKPLVGDEELASVLSAKIDDGVNWVSHPLPALQARSVMSILAGHHDGLRIVRSLMMRMP